MKLLSFRHRAPQRHLPLLLCAALILFAATFVQAKEGDAPRVAVKAVYKTNVIPVGQSADLGVLFDVPKGHHITDVDNGLFYVNARDTFGLHFGTPQFPAGTPFRGERAYRGRAIVLLQVTATDSARPGTYIFPLEIGYQICQEFGNEICFLPVTENITCVTTVVSAGTIAQTANQAEFSAMPAEVETQALTLEERLTQALNKGSWLAFLLVFVGGILASFTPCVYPVIPITIGYIGGASKGKPLRGLGLSAIYVLGIAIIYSSLGLISAATGSLFGSFSGSPIVTAIVSAIFLLMGLSMLGAFEIALPSSLQSKMQSSSKSAGLLGPLLVGMVSGLVMAPCVGPIIVALLAWVSKSGNLFLGWALLFVFSLGLGVLFLVIGTFAGAIQALPKAGVWMDNVKKGFGWILLAAALYLLRLMIPQPYFTAAWGVLLIIFAVFSGAFDRLTSETGAGKRVWKIITIIALIVGAILLFKAIYPSGKNAAPVAAEISWMVNKEEDALAAAKSGNQPLIIDVYADWCVACVELDHKTYSVPAVAARLNNFVRLKLDFTKETPWVKEMKAKYSITGMPTVIFYHPSGDEVTRFTGFKSPQDFLVLLDKNNL
jgi:thioredoxin:protein disulfide reductase